MDPETFKRVDEQVDALAEQIDSLIESPAFAQIQDTLRKLSDAAGNVTEVLPGVLDNGSGTGLINAGGGTLTLPDGLYDVEMVAGDFDDQWATAHQQMQSPGTTTISGIRWLHSITALPVEDEPEPTLEERVADLEEDVMALGQEQNEFEAKIADLETDLDALMRAVSRLEDQMRGIHEATQEG